MNRTTRQRVVALQALVLLGAGAAGAQTQTTPPAGEVRAPEQAAPSTSAPRDSETRAHMRSSHTVDVIAPGEKVDTILGRMRPERPLPPPRGDALRPPPGPDAHGGTPPQEPGHAQQSRPLDKGRDNGRDTGRPPPPPSPRTDGTPPPPSSPRPPPPR